MLAQQVFTNLGNAFLPLKAVFFTLKPLKLTVLWRMNHKIVDFWGVKKLFFFFTMYFYYA